MDMFTFTNQETGETIEMTMEEFMAAMDEGGLTVQQQIHHADGTVTSSTIYGNNVGDGIDRSMNVFATAGDIFKTALQVARKIKDADENAEKLFFMDDSDVDYEVTVDDTSLPVMHVMTCTKEQVTVARYTRDERKTVGVPMESLDILFENGEIAATLDEVQADTLLLFAFGVYHLRRILRQRGILQELQSLGNRRSGVLITTTEEGRMDARVVCGADRPDLPCMLFGGLFGQDLEDAVMMRPYVDEVMSDAGYFNPMWGALDDFDDFDDFDDYDEYDEYEDYDDAFGVSNGGDPAEKEALKAEAKAFMETVIANDNGTIVSLLMNTNRNCLTSMSDGSAAVGLEALCEEGYIFFENEDIDWEAAKDCFIVLTKEKGAGFFGGMDRQYVFNILCRLRANDLDGYKTRALEICSALNSMLNGYTTSYGEKLFYMMCHSQVLSDEYGITSLIFTTNNSYSSNEGFNVLECYEKDNYAVFEHLLEDQDIKQRLAGKGVAEAYEEGYILLTEEFSENDAKGYDSWIILAWDFSAQTLLTVVPVARDERELEALVTAIKKRLHNFVLPIRGPLNYEADISQEKFELSDELVGAILGFR